MGRCSAIIQVQGDGIMRKFVKTLCCLLAVMFMFSATALAKDSVAQRREETRTKTKEALALLYKKQPKARKAISDSYGYAVFVDTNYAVGFLGAGHGRGRAVNRTNSAEIFMKMKEYQVGLGLGVKQTNIVFVFDNIEAFSNFVNKGWTYGGNATAAVTDGVHGDSLEGAFQVASGTWMYQFSTKGLVAELALKGTNFYVDNDLNETKIPKVTIPEK